VKRAMSSFYRAAVCTALEGPGALIIEERPVLPLDAGSVRIAVRAAGLNFPDLLMTRGAYQFRPDPPFVPGMEVSGEIIEVSAGVVGLSVGDRVMSGGKGGGLAEQFVAKADAVKALPDALSFDEGACWSGAAVTAWHALHDKANVNPGETVLVLGASGGVGMAAVMLAAHKGALVIGTGSTDAKRAAILGAGASHALDPANPELAAKVKALTGGKGVDVVYDPVGGELSITATRAIAWGGRFLIVGFASGTIPSFPANHAMIKGYSLIGLRAGESGRRDPALAVQTQSALADLAARGVMRPHISHRFALSDAASGLRVLEKREVVGRAIVSP
jgi:NADPH:quinone reductase